LELFKNYRIIHISCHGNENESKSTSFLEIEFKDRVGICDTIRAKDIKNSFNN